MINFLSVAISYIESGYSVFPLQPRSKTPATAHGFKDATRDPHPIMAWWTRMPSANIGIATGAVSGIVVIDVDGVEGAKEWVNLLNELGQKHPVTLAALTGGNGQHFVFKHPGQHIGNSPLSKDLHVRADGGYIVAPPSIHPSGNEYRWLNDLAPAELPVWLLERLISRVPKAVLPPPVNDTKPIERSNSHTGSGNDDDFYAQAALDRACDYIRGAGEGQRNETLNRKAYSLGALVREGRLSQNVVESALTSAAAAAGLSEHEIPKTIASGISAGIANAWR